MFPFNKPLAVMAAKKSGPEAFAFIVKAIEGNKNIAYADVREKAEAKGFTVFPIMFGRAKALLGLVKSKKRGEGKAAKIAKAQAGKRGRPMGGGESKSGRIRELLKSGMSAAEIAKQVGCTVGLVYNVKSNSGKPGQAAMRRGPGRPPMTVKRGPGRPRKSAAAVGSLDAVINALKDGEQERARLAKAFESIRAILESVT